MNKPSVQHLRLLSERTKALSVTMHQCARKRPKASEIEIAAVAGDAMALAIDRYVVAMTRAIDRIEAESAK